MVDKFNTPSERLKMICETFYGGNKSKLAKALDVSYQNVNNYLEKGKKPSIEVVQKVYELYNDRINPDWLLLGEGDMFKEGSNIYTPVASSIGTSVAASTSSPSSTNLPKSSNLTTQLFEYQGMIIELQQKVIRHLEK
jgi:DNA-binding XRE family transcriptional regulator